MMRALVLLTAFISFVGLLASCSLDDPNVNFDAEFIPAVSVDAPQFMVEGVTYSFKLYYRRPTDCYYYNGFSTQQNGNDFTIAISSIVLDNDCGPVQTADSEVATFDFQCPHGSFNEYIFHFYGGQDATGTAQFFDFTVPVQ